MKAATTLFAFLLIYDVSSLQHQSVNRSHEHNTVIIDRGSDPTVTLGLCEGDCDEDSDCDGHLICYQRRYSQSPIPPNCYGVAEGSHDYCFDPDSVEPYEDKDEIRDVGSDPETNINKLGRCVGDCDEDDDCATGLLCYERDSGDPSPPNCVGTPYSDFDYCYDPDISTTKLGNCEGDCNSDEDCEDNLICYMRNNGDIIPPHCLGNPTDNEDYCFDPDAIQPYHDLDSLRDIGRDPDTSISKLGRCAGDCDDDEDCATGLLCYERNLGELGPPGCNGAVNKDFDYCYDPEDEPSSLNDFGSEPNKAKLDLCEGDCDTDEDCDGHLLCYQRLYSDSPIPYGCVGSAVDNHDYCFDPDSIQPYVDMTSLRDIGSEPDTTIKKLGQCAGDCDSDQDCSEGLKCYERNFNGPNPPGCEGVPYDIFDYCYYDQTLNHIMTNTASLGECEGDCNTDQDCKDHLICYQRNLNGPIPTGCSGIPEDDIDYCFDPRTIYEDLPTLRDAGLKPETSLHKLGRCAGNCDDDEDCAAGLQCYQRNINGPNPPECIGTPYEDFDYCYDPEDEPSLISVEFEGIISAFSVFPGEISLRIQPPDIHECEKGKESILVEYDSTLLEYYLFVSVVDDKESVSLDCNRSITSLIETFDKEELSETHFRYQFKGNEIQNSTIIVDLPTSGTYVDMFMIASYDTTYSTSRGDAEALRLHVSGVNPVLKDEITLVGLFVPTDTFIVDFIDDADQSFVNFTTMSQTFPAHHEALDLKADDYIVGFDSTQFKSFLRQIIQKDDSQSTSTSLVYTVRHLRFTDLYTSLDFSASLPTSSRRKYVDTNSDAILDDDTFTSVASRKELNRNGLVIGDVNEVIGPKESIDRFLANRAKELGKYDGYENKPIKHSDKITTEHMDLSVDMRVYIKDEEVHYADVILGADFYCNSEYNSGSNTQRRLEDHLNPSSADIPSTEPSTNEPSNFPTMVPNDDCLACNQFMGRPGRYLTKTDAAKCTCKQFDLHGEFTFPSIKEHTSKPDEFIFMSIGWDPVIDFLDSQDITDQVGTTNADEILLPTKFSGSVFTGVQYDITSDPDQPLNHIRTQRKFECGRNKTQRCFLAYDEKPESNIKLAIANQEDFLKTNSLIYGISISFSDDLLNSQSVNELEENFEVETKGNEASIKYDIHLSTTRNGSCSIDGCSIDGKETLESQTDVCESIPEFVSTFSPTGQPSFTPSDIPSLKPSSLPSLRPSLVPSALPTLKPSLSPSEYPSSTPSSLPSYKPSRSPLPSSAPNANPSSGPTANPSIRPSYFPTLTPSIIPSTMPTVKPSKKPTSVPSAVPSVQPSLSTAPTHRPSLRPTVTPTCPRGKGKGKGQNGYGCTTPTPSAAPSKTCPPENQNDRFFTGNLKYKANGKTKPETRKCKSLANCGIWKKKKFCSMTVGYGNRKPAREICTQSCCNL